MDPQILLKSTDNVWISLSSPQIGDKLSTLLMADAHKVRPHRLNTGRLLVTFAGVARDELTAEMVLELVNRLRVEEWLLSREVRLITLSSTFVGAPRCHRPRQAVAPPPVSEAGETA